MYTDEGFFKQLKVILYKQTDDILKAYESHADMLCLIGCMNMIEFMGGLFNGKIGLEGEAKSRFQAGFASFTDGWKRSIFSSRRIIFDEDDMWFLRCSLTHQYTPVVPKYQAVIVKGNEGNEIRFLYGNNQSNGTTDNRLIVSIPIEGLMIELAGVRLKLLNLLEQDEEMRDRANEALSRLPEIIIDESV